MNKTYLWSLDSWGSDYAPENAVEIINRANELIEAYADTTDDEEAVQSYSERLWDTFCETGKLPEKKWDICFSNDGKVKVMARGFFEKKSKLSFQAWNSADYIEIGSYRYPREYNRASLTEARYKALRRFFQSVGLVEQYDELVNDQAPTTATVYADGPFNYELVGVRAVEAAAEFQQRYDTLMRTYHGPREHLLQDLSDIRKEIAQKYNIEIH